MFINGLLYALMNYSASFFVKFLRLFGGEKKTTKFYKRYIYIYLDVHKVKDIGYPRDL